MRGKWNAVSMEEDGEWCGVKEEDRVLLVFLFLFNLNH
jgi:hypothetical protein